MLRETTQELEFGGRRVQVNDSPSGQDDSKTELAPKGPSYPPQLQACKGITFAADCGGARSADEGNCSNNKTTERGKIVGDGQGTQECTGRHSRHK